MLLEGRRVGALIWRMPVKAGNVPAGANTAGIKHMADEKPSGSGLGGNSVIVLLVAAAGALYVGWQKPPLISSRPTDLGAELHDVRSPQDVDARLWQDP
jgi:hypothetical protein